VVATRHAGIRDIVLDGKTGFLSDEGDIEGMANSMIQLANNPALAEQLGQAARARVCAEFSMEKSIRGLWQIITAALQGR
jgi:glycosyltransferase involved in cell wall biosynthesis